MSSANVPVIIPITVTPAGVTIDFTSVGRMASVYISYVSGPSNVFLSFDAMPPSAALQSGVLELNSSIPIFNLDNTAYQTIGLIVPAAGSAVVQVVGLQRPQ